MRAVVAMLALAGCRMGFDPIDTEQQVSAGIDAAASDAAIATPDGPPAGTPCGMRIAPTDNMYLPRAQCFVEVDAARTQCNADAACVLTSWYWYPGAGINDTGACADGGGGETGLRQWICSTRAMIAADQREI